MDAAIRADRLVRFLSLKPSYFVGDSRRHMTYEEVALYATRQRQQCRNDSATLASGAPDPRWENRAAPPPRPVPPPVTYMETDDEANQCAVCMVQPRNTLLRPCGHVSMCLTCAQRMLQQSPRAACVVCRSPIEDLLPIPNMTALPQSTLAGLLMQAEEPQSDSQDETQSDTQDDASSHSGSFDGMMREPPAYDGIVQFLEPLDVTTEMGVPMVAHSLRR